MRLAIMELIRTPTMETQPVISATIMTASSLEASEASHSAATVNADFAAWRNQHIMQPKKARGVGQARNSIWDVSPKTAHFYLLVFVSYFFILTIHFLIPLCSRPGSRDCGALDELYIQHAHFCGRVPAFDLTL